MALGSIDKYKMNDLKEIAKENGISLTYKDSNNKRKTYTKQTLYEEIKKRN